ncbi:hypothetical protein E2C01_067839 [Portunus trituberculatus]|uniref:Uncharacterized protein n=1 Tax=Portunus trituberculatus TaxID=210409 RepID=A0A5B7HW83_PORTR|nr:hypothetical protein [Portunus trituberculatus]
MVSVGSPRREHISTGAAAVRPHIQCPSLLPPSFPPNSRIPSQHSKRDYSLTTSSGRERHVLI